MSEDGDWIKQMVPYSRFTKECSVPKIFKCFIVCVCFFFYILIKLKSFIKTFRHITKLVEVVTLAFDINHTFVRGI